MTTAHWHLFLNHVPIISGIVGTLILATGFSINNKTVKRTALGVLIFSGLVAIPAYLTGEGAEEVIENIPGTSKAMIEYHEDSGKLFLLASVVLSILSLVAFILDLRHAKNIRGIYLLILLLSIGASLLGVQTGAGGGKIRHTEIYASPQSETNSSPGENEDGED
jgi:hypothetical protein